MPHWSHDTFNWAQGTSLIPFEDSLAQREFDSRQLSEATLPYADPARVREALLSFMKILWMPEPFAKEAMEFIQDRLEQATAEAREMERRMLVVRTRDIRPARALPSRMRDSLVIDED